MIGWPAPPRLRLSRVGAGLAINGKPARWAAESIPTSPMAANSPVPQSLETNGSPQNAAPASNGLGAAQSLGRRSGYGAVQEKATGALRFAPTRFHASAPNNHRASCIARFSDVHGRWLINRNDGLVTVWDR